MLNADVCADLNFIDHVPFSSIVKSKPHDFPPQLRQFHRFSELPPELRLLVFEYCDTGTIFQLMHTGSDVRAIASKVFWACKTYWYRIDPDRYFGRPNHQPRDHDLCPQAAQHIVQLVISCTAIDWYSSQGDSDEIWRWLRSVKSVMQQTNSIWKVVSKSFPAARKVVISGFHPEDPEVYRGLEYTARSAPSSITPYFAFLNPFEPEAPINRTHELWRVEFTPEPQWRLIDPSWEPSQVNPPSSKLPSGPLGDFLYHERIRRKLEEESQGLHWLAVKTHELYTGIDKFECPMPDCDAEFTRRCHLEDHLEDSLHSTSFRRAHNLNPCHWNTPITEYTSIEAKRIRITQLTDEVDRVWRSLLDNHGQAGTEKRREFETKFISQMREHDVVLPWRDGDRSLSWAHDILSNAV